MSEPTHAPSVAPVSNAPKVPGAPGAPTVPTVPRVPRVLSIAGSDPSGGAGIQADLKSIAANGGYGMAVITALTAQNTRGVRGVHITPAAFVRAQLDSVSDDIEIDAVKIGMLANAEVIDAVAAWLARVRPPIVVLDPVMVATSGDRLLDAEAEAALHRLVPLVGLITPNMRELSVLAGEPAVTDWHDVLDQAERASRLLGVRVLAKGGHLEGATAPDALVDASLAASARIIEFTGDRIATSATHGTGCSLSSALATQLAAQSADAPWADAIVRARAWLRESLRAGEPLGVGSGHGPISHFAGLWQRGGLETRSTPSEIEADWWQRIADVRRAIDELAFIRQLADGTLARDPFLDYLAQDAIYLGEYSRVLAAASQLAPDPDEQTFWANGAHGSLAGELELHRSWLDAAADVAAGGAADGAAARATDGTAPATRTRTTSAAPGSYRDRVEQSPTTIAYLNHLVAASARADYAVVVAAVLPCYWLYTDLGERLAAGEFGAASLAADHPYASWLETYGDPVFAEATRTAVSIMTTLAVEATPERREAMWRAFRTSAEHELAFFAAPLEPAR